MLSITSFPLWRFPSARAAWSPELPRDRGPVLRDPYPRGHPGEGKGFRLCRQSQRHTLPAGTRIVLVDALLADTLLAVTLLVRALLAVTLLAHTLFAHTLFAMHCLHIHCLHIHFLQVHCLMLCSWGGKSPCSRQETYVSCRLLRYNLYTRMYRLYRSSSDGFPHGE